MIGVLLVSSPTPRPITWAKEVGVMKSWEMMAALILRTCESSSQEWGSAGWTPEVL